MTSRAMQFLKDKEHSMSAKRPSESKKVDPNLHTPGMMDGEMQFDGDDDLVFQNQEAMNNLDPAETEMLAAGLNHMKYE